jgi:hypothetical protein
MQIQQHQLPELPLDAWENSKMTLHLYLQIVGKIRLTTMPRKNHWWNLTLYISPKGLTTHAIPYENGTETFEITFNFIEHQLELVTSRGEFFAISLENGLSVCEFHESLFSSLSQLGIDVTIVDKPYDLPIKKPFSEISEYASYQKEFVQRFWRIMMWVDGVFNEFSGRFYGKTCPVHLYWHHMDLAVTRFSGKKGPALSADMSVSEKDAYSHEVISFGFWAGDENLREPAFYSYTYPSPKGLDKEKLLPDPANWVDSNGSPMAMLMYNDLRKEAIPRESLLSFLESAYQAGAKLAGWDYEELKVPSLSQL